MGISALRGKAAKELDSFPLDWDALELRETVANCPVPDRDGPLPFLHKFCFKKPNGAKNKDMLLTFKRPPRPIGFTFVIELNLYKQIEHFKAEKEVCPLVMIVLKNAYPNAVSRTR